MTDPEGQDRQDTSQRGDSERQEERITASQAYTVDTTVTEERGQWAVDIVVLFDDEVVRKRISVHRTERLAQISADLIKRAAERDIGGPIHG